MKNLFAYFAIVIILAFGGCGGGGASDSAPAQKPDPTTGLTPDTVELNAEAFVDAPIDKNATVDIKGGTVEITTGPLAGTKIVIPEGAVSEAVTFSVSYSNISAKGLTENAKAAGRVIRISASGSENWNKYRIFDKVVEVTLPYPEFTDEVDEDTVRFYYYDPTMETFESEGYRAIDTVKNTVTFYTNSFADTAPELDAGTSVRSTQTRVNNTYADYVAVGLNAQYFSSLLGGATLDTGFRPSKNGWYIPNYGSFYKGSKGGNCMGMVAFAKFYYAKGYSKNLYSNYKDAEPTTTWLDDEVAIQLASRVHNEMVWDDIVDKELDKQLASSMGVFRSLVGALVVTKRPALMAIYEKRLNPLSLVGGHAISVYKIELSGTEIVYHIYDPNFKGDDDNRRITLTLDGHGRGRFKSYPGGTTAQTSRYKYNYFNHFGYRAGYTQAMMENLKKLADKGFAGDNRFPTFKLTKITAKTSGEVIFDAENPSETSDEEKGFTLEGQEKYITEDTAVIIEGTVTGGISQEEKNVVNNLNISTSSGTITAAINNKADGSGDGKFSFTLPLKGGENMISMIASEKGNKYSQWAAFKLLIIESKHQPAYMTVTLNWGKDNSDIDLWVTEPGGESVGFSHRKGVSTINPYLDFDNTQGYGPEHYVAIEGMSIPGSTTGLYGRYSIIANYWGDDDDDYEHTQAVPWTINWRYLEYCPDPCKNPEDDGFWNEGSASGVLTAEGENSSPIILNYEKPDLDEWEIVPESHDVMLP